MATGFWISLWRQGRGYVAVNLMFNDQQIGTLYDRCKAAERPAAEARLRVRIDDPKVRTEFLAKARIDSERALINAEESVRFYQEKLRLLKGDAP